MKRILETLVALVVVLSTIECYPNLRTPEHLPYIDYLAQDLAALNYLPLEAETRAAPPPLATRKRPFDSPVYYIRVPPQPYVFVEGLGYVSARQPSPLSPFLNVPVSFVSNGKPSSIYQWAGGAKPPREPAEDSAVHKLPGAYGFNGKPDEVFLLRDSYDSMYSDVLQNVYP